MITGGAGGIGVVYAEALCEAGRRRRRRRPRPAHAATATARGPGGEGPHGDRRRRRRARRPSRRRRWPPAAVDAFGGIDILINNAAIMADLPPFGLGEHAGRRVGPRHRRQPPRPAAVHAGGRPGDGGPRRRPHRQRPVGRRLHARRHLRRQQVRPPRPDVNLASELGGRGINVNAIAPGLVDNESGYVSLPKDSPFRDAIAATIPGKPSGPPEDLVGTLLLLCSQGRRLDHRPDDPRRRRLDHPPLSRGK